MSDARTDTAVLLPDGTPFPFWERTQEFSRTYHVSQGHPKAADDGPGSETVPFRTIGAAALLAQPGERVLVHAGIYRERVRPARGGAGPDRMISYEAAPDESVVIRGSEVYDGAWEEIKTHGDGPILWEIALPELWFTGVNPFGMVNLSRYDDGEELASNSGRLKDPMMRVYLMRRGLVFQDGRRLRQVFLREELSDEEGAYWVDRDGLDVVIRPFGDVDPHSAMFEMTARQHCFAPSTRYLGYLRVKGFRMEHVGDGFPRPQGGLLSAMRGHHWIIEDCVIRQANAIGMDLGSQTKYEQNTSAGNHVVRGCLIEECGISGICGTGNPANLLVEDNLLRGNCLQNIGNLEEAAAIKFHVTRNALIRRNLILDTGGPSGNGAGIWLDWDCRNSRVCQNVVRGTRTVYGALFVEASRSKEVNLLDHNIILETKGHGIYAHNGDRLQVRHNLIAGSTGTAVQLGWADPSLIVATDGEGPRGSTGRRNIVIGNLLIDNARRIEFSNPDNTSDFNAFSTSGGEDAGPLRLRVLQENLNLPAWQEFHGLDASSAEVSATLTVEDDTLTLVTDNALPEAPGYCICSTDFTGTLRGLNGPAGPISKIRQGERVRVNLDPRLQGPKETR